MNDATPKESQSFAAVLIALFGSSATLLCCALPALVAAVAGGAAVVSLVSTVPGLIWLSERKTILFAFTIAALIAGGITLWRAQRAPCPADPALARVCLRMRQINKAVYFVSCGFFIIGITFAYILPRLMATGVL